jgi:hypothetical protein
MTEKHFGIANHIHGGDAMMKNGLLFLVVLVLLIPLFFLSSVSAKARLTEEQALKVLISTIEKEKLYGNDPNMSCLSISPGESGKDHFDFSVHENHGGKCPGNPNASPGVDRFRVERSTRKVQWYDPGEDRLLSLRAFTKSKSKR